VEVFRMARYACMHNVCGTFRGKPVLHFHGTVWYLPWRMDIPATPAILQDGVTCHRDEHSALLTLFRRSLPKARLGSSGTPPRITVGLFPVMDGRIFTTVAYPSRAFCAGCLALGGSSVHVLALLQEAAGRSGELVLLRYFCCMTRLFCSTRCRCLLRGDSILGVAATNGGDVANQTRRRRCLNDDGRRGGGR